MFFVWVFIYHDFLVDLSDVLITMLCFYYIILPKLQYVGHGKCIYFWSGSRVSKTWHISKANSSTGLANGNERKPGQVRISFSCLFNFKPIHLFIQLWRDQWRTGINCQVGLGKINWVKLKQNKVQNIVIVRQVTNLTPFAKRICEARIVQTEWTPKDTAKPLYHNVKLYLFIRSLPCGRLLNPGSNFKLVISRVKCEQLNHGMKWAFDSVHSASHKKMIQASKNEPI